MNWKILIAIIIVIAGGAFVLTRFGGTPSDTLVKNESGQTPMATPASAPDAAVDAIIASSGKEDAVLNDEDNDMQELTADSQSVSDVGQSYSDADY